ncbi:hypothetical protein M422DRAFT_259786 [Sphaerobolus stellatus SS14]|uniref:Uncharacterized protein n=1 Tax=Sphaerobolus stellatus (strain SS14) TaxID=990650 RepID=A0A0C9V800_SPHS4|nr:hypothetical protein M422DRAFT_259786 [Sphaerobolus stellatus SS14]
MAMEDGLEAIMEHTRQLLTTVTNDHTLRRRNPKSQKEELIDKETRRQEMQDYIRDTLREIQHFQQPPQVAQTGSNSQAAPGPGPSTLANAKAATLKVAKKALEDNVSMEDSNNNKEHKKE